jgi:hypothetical protein
MAAINTPAELKILNPVEELTLTDRQQFRVNAIMAGVQRALDKKVAPSAAELVVRAPANIADFVTALDRWQTAPLVTVDTSYSVFQAVAAPQVLITQVVVFYKVTVATAPIPVERITFREGTNATTTRAFFDLEQLDGYLIPSGYFSEPIVYDPQQIMNIVVKTRIATGLAANVILGGFIIEPKGANIS